MSASTPRPKLEKDRAVPIFRDLFGNDNLREVELVEKLDEKRFGVQLWVMSTPREYFREWSFELKFGDGQKREFDIPDVDGATLEPIFEFCYSGEGELDGKKVKRMLAEPLELAQNEENRLIVWITFSSLVNCIEIFLEADKYSWTSLREKSFNYICDNFDQIPAPEFVKIGKPLMTELLQSENIYSREDFIFLRMTEWINHNKSARSQYVTEMMELIRMNRITQPFLRDVVTSFAEKYKCMDLIHCEYIRRADDDNMSTNLLRCEVESPESIFVVSCESGVMNVAKYYPIPNRWELFRNIPIQGLMTTRTSFGVMFATINHIFTVGGQENDSYVKKVDMHYLDEMQSKTRPNLSKERSHIMPIMFDGKMFVFGGFNGAAMSTCECLTVTTKKVKKVASMQFGRYNYAGTVWNGKIYVAGGQTAENTRLNSVECYDPASNMWTKIASMRNARANFALVVSGQINGILLAVGDHKKVEIYNQNQDEWFEIGSLSFDGSDTVIQAVNLHNEIYVLLRDGRFGKFDIESKKFVCQPLRNSPLSSGTSRHLFVH